MIAQFCRKGEIWRDLTCSRLAPSNLESVRPEIGAAIVTLVVLAAAVLTIVTLVRKFLRNNAPSAPGAWSSPAPNMENPSAFMTASMQGVIEKLRAQEKELARLNLLAQERAQESERLTEEVTRNMPSTGQPAARQR